MEEDLAHVRASSDDQATTLQQLAARLQDLLQVVSACQGRVASQSDDISQAMLRVDDLKCQVCTAYLQCRTAVLPYSPLPQCPLVARLSKVFVMHRLIRLQARRHDGHLHTALSEPPQRACFAPKC